MQLLALRNYILSLLIATLQIQVEGVTNQMHSVLQCDPIPAHQPFVQTELVCKNYCQKTYVEVDADILKANDDLAQFYVELPGTSTAKCCCLFNSRWPKFVNLKAVRRDQVFMRPRAKKVGDCLPIVISLNLSKRTKESYDTLCRHLSKRERLTMLEIMDFAEAAAYLNMMKPKHPVIMKTIAAKDVQKVTKESLRELREQFNPNLLVTAKSSEDFEGYHLKTDRLRKFILTRGAISEAIRAPLIAEAFDELVTSYSLVDIHAASLRVNELSKALMIPENLLNNDYDNYNPNSRAQYFKLDRIDCSMLHKTRLQISNYISAVKAVLSALREKLVFESVSESFKPMQDLIQAEKIYRSVDDLSCGPVTRRN